MENLSKTDQTSLPPRLPHLEMEKKADTLLMKIPTQQSSAWAVIDSCKAFMDELGVFDTLGIIVVLRELLNNALVHGNRGDMKNKVLIQIEYLKNSSFKIVVQDEGAGFDYHSLALELPEDPRKHRTRGYALINSLSSKLEFNDKGNRIAAIVTAA